MCTCGGPQCCEGLPGSLLPGLHAAAFNNNLPYSFPENLFHVAVGYLDDKHYESLLIIKRFLVFAAVVVWFWFFETGFLCVALEPVLELAL